jgi:hypothetical protein
MPKFKLYLIVTFLLFFSKSNAQFGGWASYAFLKIPSDANTTALGGQNVAPITSDPSLFLNNPALLDSIKKHHLKINYAPLWAGTNSSTITYSRNHKKTGNIAASLQFVNYGTFKGTDASGNLTNNFSANDFALIIGHSQKVNNISIGANIKFAGSTIESYSSYAILADFGGFFKHPKKEISYGLVIKNMGGRIKNFTKNDMQNLPFDVQMGFTIRPEQMPFRFSLNAHHLHQWLISDNETSQLNLLSNQLETKNTNFINKLSQHFVVGVETFIHPNFQLNVGYNALLRKELKQVNLSSFSGFSYGFVMKTKKINFGVGHQGFALAGGLTQVSFSTQLK